ncbi:10790_t:CDS:1, partial [Dentiscutata heterogama]
ALRVSPKLIPAGMTDFNRFPFNNFTYYLTLFSKYFSSFPHGTCSLSVSRLYLALGEIYHPFRAAFPNNSTLRKRIK